MATPRQSTAQHANLVLTTILLPSTCGGAFEVVGNEDASQRQTQRLLAIPVRVHALTRFACGKTATEKVAELTRRSRPTNSMVAHALRRSGIRHGIAQLVK